MKIKIALIGKREWTKKKIVEFGGAEDGNEITCYFYSGFMKGDKPIEFKSNNDDYKINEGLMGYDEEKAKEYDIEAQIDSFKNKVKYREVDEMNKR